MRHRHPRTSPSGEAPQLDASPPQCRADIWREEFARAGGAFRVAFENAAIGMAIVHLNGTFLKVNRSYCTICGYDEAELLATNFQAITHPDDVEADVALARQLINGQITHYHMEKRYLHKRGNAIWVQLSVSIMRDEAGVPCYFIAQIQDITARKQAELDGERRLHQLERLTHTVTQLLRDLDETPDTTQYQRWLRILLDSFASPTGWFLRTGHDDTLIGVCVRGAHDEPVHCTPPLRYELWNRAITQRCIVIENEAHVLEGGRLVARSLAGPIVHEGAVLGVIHLADAGADYDGDDRDLLQRVTRMMAPVVHARSKRDALTPREIEVMDMLVAGMSQKQIAFALKITVQTAAKHRARILDKLDVGNDVELARLAEQMRRPTFLLAGLE